MNRDASLPPNAPMTAAMTNGSLTPRHGEVDASSTAQRSPHPRQTHTQSLEEVCKDVHERVQAFLSAEAETDAVLRGAQEQVRLGIGVIEKALEDYGFEHLSLSYNGGKDCLVLLLLYLSVLHTYFHKPRSKRKKEASTSDPLDQGEEEAEGEAEIQPFPETIPSIYAKPPDPFPLVSSFVESSSQRYHLDLIHISTNPGSNPKAKSHSSPPPRDTLPISAQHTPADSSTTDSASTTEAPPLDEAPSDNLLDSKITFRDAFALYLSHYRPACRAIFVGTRRTDPHGATLSAFQLTDGLWPRFMRIHPVLDFTLGQVWVFLRHLSIRDGDIPGSKATRELIDYCQMYDQGYTSLGGVGDTLKNPKLKDDGVEGEYRPAWSMVDDGAERAGRE